MADKEFNFRLGMDASKAQTNLKAFREEFEATLRAAGSDTTEITAFRRMVRDIEAGRTSVNQLSAAQQEMWRAYSTGADLARDKDAVGLRNHAALTAEIDRVTAAYSRLAASGTLSESELAQAASMAEAKVAALNTELTRGQQGARAIATLEAEVRRLTSTLEQAHAAGSTAFDVSPGVRAAEAQIAKLRTEIDSVGKSADTAGKELQQAFGTLGVRPIKDVEAEIAKLKEALDTLRKSGASFTDLQNATQAYEAKVAKLRTEIGRAGLAMQNAFGVVGVRSAHQIETEIQAVDHALGQLARDTRVTETEFNRAFGAGQAKIAALKAEMAGVSGKVTESSSALGSFGSMLGKLGPLAMAAQGALVAAFGVKKFYDTNVAFQSVERSLTAINGSAQAASKDMAFLAETANRTGQNTLELSKSYVQFAAATRGTRLEGDATRETFDAVSAAMALMGRSSEETGRAMVALAQMASKGTIAAEELKGQLGEAMPGALQAMAKGLGISVQELNKLVETGTLAANVAIPALVKGLHETADLNKPIDGLAASWARLGNQIDKANKLLGDKGGAGLMANSVDAGTRSLKIFDGTLNGAMLTARQMLQSFALLYPEMQKLVDMPYKKSLLDGKTYGLVGAELDALRRSVGLTEAEIKRLNATSGTSKKATDALSEAYNKNTVEMGRRATQLKQDVQNLEKLAAAAKKAGDAAKTSANTFGTEAEKLKANADAAKQNADALQKLADAKVQEATLTQQAVQLEVQHNQALGDSSTAALDAVAGKQKLADAAKAEAATAVEAARAAAEEAAAQKVIALVYQDNAGKVDQYRQAMDAAAKEADKMNAAEQGSAYFSGMAADARRRLQEATVLYRDALSDATDAARRNVAVIEQSATIDAKKMQMDVGRLQQSYELAKATGREREASALLLQIKLKEAEVKELGAKASIASANAMMVEADRQEMLAKATGQLTTEKKFEIDSMRRAAEAKQLDGKAALQAADNMRQLARATQSAGSNPDPFRNTRNSLANADGKARELIADLERISGLQNGNGGGSGGNGGGGNQYSVGSTDPASKEGVYAGLATTDEDVKTKLAAAGVSADKLDEALAYYKNQIIVREAQARKNMPYYTEHGLDYLAAAFNNAIADSAAYAQKKSGASSTGSGSADSTTSSADSTPSNGEGNVQRMSQHTYTVNLNIGGSSTPVQVASQSDAQALIDALTKAAKSSS